MRASGAAFYAALLFASGRHAQASLWFDNCIDKCIKDTSCDPSDWKCMCKAAKGNFMPVILGKMLQNSCTSELRNSETQFIRVMETGCNAVLLGIPEQNVKAAESASSSLVAKLSSPTSAAPRSTAAPPPPPPAQTTTAAPPPPPPPPPPASSQQTSEASPPPSSSVTPAESSTAPPAQDTSSSSAPSAVQSSSAEDRAPPTDSTARTTGPPSTTLVGQTTAATSSTSTQSSTPTASPNDCRPDSSPFGTRCNSSTQMQPSLLSLLATVLSLLVGAGAFAIA